jgi:F-type H+-transporting ATPase subunit epsilon
MSMTMRLYIASAEEQIFSGTVVQVHAPGEMGEVGIFPRHTQLLTRMRPGEVRVHKQGGEIENFYVSGGVLEVQPHVVTVLADVAQRARDVDEVAAREAMERAAKLLEERGNSTELDISRAQADMAEASAKIRIAQKLRENMKTMRK